MTKISAPPEDPLLSRVREVLDGTLGTRAWKHPGRSHAVAVRTPFPDAAALALESAGLLVERKQGWLEVVEQAQVRGSAA